MNNNVNTLIKTDNKLGKSTDNRLAKSLEDSAKYINTKRKINEICKALSEDTKNYDPSTTVESIQAYLDNKDKIERILYSEISIYIFSLNASAKGTIATNIEKLMIHALNANSQDITEDCCKIIVKIYDHFQLALNQTENLKTKLGSSIDDTKNDLKKEIKGIEKEYISILGIFAAIVLAFVGGTTFSSSVLQNIHSVSIYRLLIVIVFLAFILTNIIWLLLQFIAEINDKSIKPFNIKLFNVACVIIAILIICGWALNVQAVPNYLYKLLPWCK